MTNFYPAPISAVAPRSLAARAGMRAGDRLLAINGEPLRDVIDVRVCAAEPALRLRWARGSREIERRVRRRYGEPLGLDFAEPIFDGPVRVCRNACEFCFVNQMAPGLRAPLYVKDDDYRLSFLHGSYITLTNLTEDDWQRIGAQGLSPLYVSVHATEPAVRASLMRNPHAGSVITQLRRLTDLGVTVHTQAVLVPGRNDGAHLDRTIADLAALHPHVRDLTLVPVGLTRWHRAAPGSAPLRPYNDAEAASVLKQASNWQARLRERLGVGFVYLADEWYLRAGAPLPPLEAYDGQLPALVENGVGMVRRFLDGWPALQKALADIGGARQTWVTGTLFAPVLRERAAAFARETGVPAEVLAVPNRAFGATVTVAGLLTVGDVLDALGVRPQDGVIVLPGEIFRGPEGRALDGGTVDDVRRATGRRVCVISHTGSVWEIQEYNSLTPMGLWCYNRQGT